MSWQGLSEKFNKRRKKKIMRKFLMVAALMVLSLTSLSHCQPTDVNVRVTWGADTTAQFFKVLAVMGPDTTLFPFEAGMSYYDLVPGTYTAEYDVYDTTLVFSSPINGEYTQLAGVLVDEYGLLSRLVITSIKAKPNEPNQMRFLDFNFEF